MPHLADCKNTDSSYATLTHTEKQWQEASGYLELMGYMLRPRYRKHWKPSWELSVNHGKSPHCFEDHIPLPMEVSA